MKRCLPLLALLAACTPQPPHPAQAMADINAEFKGKPASIFFLDFGSAADSKPDSSGGRVYRWLSIEPDMGEPHTTLFSSPEGPYGFADSSAPNGDMMAGYCEVRVFADRADRIRHIDLMYDSPGKYSGSRCAEIFGEPKK
jgi:hypothetical protein